MYLQEISLILLQVIFIYLFFNNTIISSKILGKIASIKNFTNIDFIIINIIIFLNLLILISIFSINSMYFFYLYVLLILLTLSKDFIKKIKINFSYKNIIILFLVFILSLDLAYTLELGWDTQWFWYLKALNFYQDQNFSNLKNLPIKAYPHLGPYIWGFFWKFPFGNFEYLGRIVYIFFYTLAIFSFSEILKINNHLKYIFSLIIIIATYKYDLFNGDSDILMFIFLLFAAKFTYYLYQSKKNQLLLILVLLGIANILIWIKYEAAFFILFLISSIFVCNKIINKKNKIVMITSFFFLILFKVSMLWVLDMPMIDDKSFGLQETMYFNFDEFYYRITNILFFIFVFLVQSPIYLLTLPLMIISIRLLKANPLNITILLFTFIFFSFTIFAYFFKVDQIVFQLRFSMGEFLFSASGIYLLVFANFLNTYLLKGKKTYN